MAIEPERKFLVLSDAWKSAVDHKSHIVQAYINSAVVRATVAIPFEGNGPAGLCIRGIDNADISYDLDIPMDDAGQLFVILNSKNPTLRIRVADDAKAFITIKGKAPEGSIETPEFEYSIPVADAKKLWNDICMPSRVEKTRHYVPFGGNTWEVDVFEGNNKGLIVAEIELTSGNASFEKPGWAGEEVTFEKKYSNKSLSEKPYSTWDATPGKTDARKGGFKP